MLVFQRIIIIFLIFFVSGFFITTVAFWVRQSVAKESITYKILSPLADPIGTSKGIVSALTRKPVKDVVVQAQKGTKGTYAIAIKNLNTHDTYYSNERKIFWSGSLYKLWVMAVVYEQIEKGSLKESEVLEKTIQELNNEFAIASESAELAEGGISMTVGQAMQQMIVISHNYAALLLTDKVGDDNVIAFLKKNGFNESSFISPPKTTAHDIALFFEKLYNGEIVSKSASEKMLALLKKQQLNDRIPKYLPKSIPVAHKTGEIDYFKHDSGIVFAKNGDYIFVVLSESESPSGAAERIAGLSKAVYDHFEK